MNTLAGIMLFCAATYIGINIEKYYAKKLICLRSFADFIDYCGNEIKFFKIDVFSLIADNTNFKLEDRNPLRSISSVDKVLIKNVEIPYFSASEKSMVTEFIIDLTAMNTAEQEDIIQRHKQQLDKHIIQAEREYLNKGKLTKKLAPLLGIALFLLVV